MGENIEVKDVQKTEYLDKNGLDMLWAKVKENTRNQVEAESNRAVEQETRIIETKADKSEFSNYVPSATFTALEKKVSANTTAISNKQNAGNYLHYETLNNDGYYEIPSVCISGSSGNTKTNISSQSISINDDSASCTTITPDSIVNRNNDSGDFSFVLDRDGLKLEGGDNFSVLTSNGSTIDITQYAKKTEVSDFISKTTTNDQSIKSRLNISNALKINGDNNESYAVFLQSSDDIQLQMIGADRSAKTYLDPSSLQISKSIYNITITANGIRKSDGSANYVYATDGSIADLTQYAKKSEITTGGNVDNVQVNGVSVVENKIANIKPATKESLGVVKVGDGLNVTDGTISVDSEYFVNMKSYGVEWDVTVADPTCTRIGNPLLHKQLPIQSEYKGCLVKNGKVNYYLDPNDWSKKADGAPSVLDGTDGDVMVHIPKFYGKSGSNGNKRWVRIATTKIDSSWVEIPEMFVSAYRITTYTDADKTKIASVVNTTTNYRGGGNPNISSMYDQYLNSDKFRTRLGKPRTDVDVKEMRANANNSGQELLCYEFYKWVFYWAYVIEYANFNSLKEFNSELTSDGYHQGGLGIGVSWNYDTWYKYSGKSPITPCGYTNEFGNFSGVKQILIPRTETDDSTIYETTLQANRWRGFENPFGDIVTFLDGIILDNGSANQGRKVYTTSDSSKFGDDISVMNTIGTFVGESGTIKEFDLGETGEIIPQSVDDTISYHSYKCGYSYGCAFKGNLEVAVGGRAGGDYMSGLCSFRPYNGGTDGCGFRSVVLVH